MFCPKCGKPDQEIATFCRQCGIFLPDIEKLTKKQTTPEDHLRANTVLSLITGIVSITLAIILYAMFLGKEDTPVIIYIVAGFLIAMFAWQAQTFIRNLMLKKQLRERNIITVKNEDDSNELKSNLTNELLPEADLSDIVPISVTENTTKTLKEKIERSS